MTSRAVRNAHASGLGCAADVCGIKPALGWCVNTGPRSGDRVAKAGLDIELEVVTEAGARPAARPAAAAATVETLDMEDTGVGTIDGPVVTHGIGIQEAPTAARTTSTLNKNVKWRHDTAAGTPRYDDVLPARELLHSQALDTLPGPPTKFYACFQRASNFGL